MSDRRSGNMTSGGAPVPTILTVRGWRIFFYSDEGQEPMHVHCRKAEAECKFWVRPEEYEIEEAWAHNLTPALRREVRKIVFDHMDLIAEEWNRRFGGRESEDC